MGEANDSSNVQVCIRIRPPHDPSEDFNEIFGFPPDREQRGRW